MGLKDNSFENTVGKGEIARNEQFSFSHSVFYLFGELSAVVIKFKVVVFNLLQFGRVQKLKGLMAEKLVENKVGKGEIAHNVKEKRRNCLLREICIFLTCTADT